MQRGRGLMRRGCDLMRRGCDLMRRSRDLMRRGRDLMRRGCDLMRRGRATGKVPLRGNGQPRRRKFPEVRAESKFVKGKKCKVKSSQLKVLA